MEDPINEIVSNENFGQECAPPQDAKKPAFETPYKDASANFIPSSNDDIAAFDDDKNIDSCGIVTSPPSKLVDEDQSYFTPASNKIDLDQDGDAKTASDDAELLEHHLTSARNKESSLKTPSKIPSVSNIPRREFTASARKSDDCRVQSKIPSISQQETKTTTPATTGGGRRRRIRQRSSPDAIAAMASADPVGGLTRNSSSDGLDQMNSDTNRKLYFIKEEKISTRAASITDRLYDDAKRKIKARQQQTEAENNDSSRNNNGAVGRSTVLDRLYEDAKQKHEARRPLKKEMAPHQKQRAGRPSSSQKQQGRPLTTLDRLFEGSKLKFSLQAEEEQQENFVKGPPTPKSPERVNELYEDAKMKYKNRQSSSSSEELQKTEQQKKEKAEHVSVLDRLYDDAKRKNEARRQAEWEELQRLEQQHHKTLEKSTDTKKGDRVSVLDRLYEDAKQKFNRQAEEELLKREEEEKALQEELEKKQKVKPNNNASRLYEDGKRKIEAMRTEEMLKREEEQKALQKTIDLKQAEEAKASLARLYDAGKRKINAQREEEEAKAREYEARLKLKAEKEFQPNMSLTAKYYEKKAKKAQVSGKNEKGGKAPAITPKASSKNRLASSVKKSATKKIQDDVTDGEETKQQPGDNFSSEFFERLQATEEKKNMKLARLKEEAEKERSYKPKNFVKNKKSRKEVQKEVQEEPENQPGKASQVDESSESDKKGIPNIFGSIFAKKQQSPKANDQVSNNAQLDEESKDDGKSLGSGSGGHLQENGKNFSAEFFERLQATEEKKNMKLARLKEEADKEFDYKPKNYVKDKKSRKESREESQIEVGNALDRADIVSHSVKKDTNNIFGSIFAKKQQPPQTNDLSSVGSRLDEESKDDGKSVGGKSGGSGGHPREDGKNFSAEFFERLQATEEKKNMKLARLKEEVEKEFSYKPKNYVKDKKDRNQAPEVTKNEADVLHDSDIGVSKSRDLFIPLDDQGQSDSEKASFFCWKPCC